MPEEWGSAERRILQRPDEPASITEIAEAVSSYASRYMAPYRSRMGSDWEDALQDVTMAIFNKRLAGHAIRKPGHYFAKTARNAFVRWCNRNSEREHPVADISVYARAVVQASEDRVVDHLEVTALLISLQEILTVKELDAFVHVELMQWTAAEYARSTGAPHSSVSSRLAAVRRKISVRWPRE
ncbi:RNA polymerase sigma factor [Serinicoccus marinus]|uniref:RNA polymerase sigma factor n=2 Tax=Serinicoccus marinus TaxID=247333 RepID=UPI00122E7515|nr:sigma-70 family RNA polymerase sigma factor [Serinicoccus marinus]